MRFFWKVVAANIVATLLTQLVFGMMMFVALMMLVALMASGGKEPSLRPGTMLVFDMSTNVTDAPQHAGPEDVLFAANGQRVSLLEVEQALDAAAGDKNIVGVFLHGSLETDNYASGYATLREVRQALAQFRTSGKPVIAYLDAPTIKDYYLATAASKIVINPFAYLPLNGLAAENMFLGDALKKYGVGVQVTRVGKYKSATEMFTNDQMSDADREQLTLLLNSMWDSILGDLAQSRGMDAAKMKDYADQPGLYLASDALKNKLVDQVGYFDEVLAQLKTLAKPALDTGSFRQITLEDYADRLTKARLDQVDSADNKIAVVYAEGEIVDGEGAAGYIGGDQLARQLRKVRQDPDIKAVVLRVNSPGGSAFASEVIQRELHLIKDSGRPLIASFGALAASGGYWISTPADHIFAEPTTITGSIGVFGLKFNLQDVAKDHGLTFDAVQTAPFAEMDTVTRPWSDAEKNLAQQMVDYIYDQFLDKVSKGRGLKLDDVKDDAQGRVWPGTKAKDLGLVDEIGGLDDAIAFAVKKADLTNKKWALTQVPERRTPQEALADWFNRAGEGPRPLSQDAAAHAMLDGPGDPLSATLRQWQTEWRQVRALNDPRGVYALLPWQVPF